MFFIFFNDTATTEIYTPSLHDAPPIYAARNPTTAPEELHPAPEPLQDRVEPRHPVRRPARARHLVPLAREEQDRKSTRLNSSHANISYAVFCLKKHNQSQATPDPIAAT